MTQCTYVLSRAPDESAAPDGPEPAKAAERHQFEDALAAALCARGCRVLIMPHLYYLGDGHPALDRVAELPGQLVVASWLHPRAAYWTLRALGVDDPDSASDEAARRIRCFDLAAFPSADAGADAMREADNSPKADSAPPPDEVAGAVAPRWYPVLDYGRCIDCGKCRDFCLFGVYEREGKRVAATHADRCKDGCPACARMCPEGAIMFPHYAADPAIAGAPGTELTGGEDDVAAFLNPTEAEKERDECAEEHDDLDDLIDALDKLDE